MCIPNAKNIGNIRFDIMSFLVSRMKFGQCCFHNRFMLMKLWTTAYDNLISIQNNINKTKFCTRSDISLPDKAINKYLNSIVTAYMAKDNRNSEFLSILKIQEVVNLLEERLHIEENIKSLEELGAQDEEIKKLGHEEYTAYQNHAIELNGKLLDIISDNIGKDYCNDIIFEITAAAGGQEAMIFTADLFNMYQKHFEYLGFHQEIIELDAESGVGGLRHVSILVSGRRAFELLRHEGGVHRVQRIPATEKYGRMQTSTTSVAVLPQPTDIEINLHEKDLKIETKRASGAGGQSVNTTDSAVRITHLPTGLSVDSQSERSQIKNKQIGLLRLRTKIYDMQLNEQKSVTGSLRKKQRGLGQRNEKIRTYNFSQDRVTDHRLTNGTLHNLKQFMEGGESLENFQERLQRLYQLKLLQEAIEKC